MQPTTIPESEGGQGRARCCWLAALCNCEREPLVIMRRRLCALLNLSLAASRSRGGTWWDLWEVPHAHTCTINGRMALLELRGGRAKGRLIRTAGGALDYIQGHLLETRRRRKARLVSRLLVLRLKRPQNASLTWRLPLRLGSRGTKGQPTILLSRLVPIVERRPAPTCAESRESRGCMQLVASNSVWAVGVRLSREFVASRGACQAILNRCPAEGVSSVILLASLELHVQACPVGAGPHIGPCR